MTKSLSKILGLSVCLGIMVCSCSVKEDRMECPCYVSVQTETATDCLVSFYGADGSLFERRIIAAADLVSGDNYTKVTKGDFYVSVLQNQGAMVLSGGRIVECARGREAEPIFSWAKGERAVDDEMTVSGILQKQHAVVTLRFVHASGQAYPYDIRVAGQCNGLDLLSLQGSAGEYVLQPAIGGDLECSFIMTRQSAGAGIVLYFLDKASGAVLGQLDLGRYIEMTGYSWETEYLGDINVLIDYARCSITIFVNDWEEGISFTYKI